MFIGFRMYREICLVITLIFVLQEIPGSQCGCVCEASLEHNQWRYHLVKTRMQRAIFTSIQDFNNNLQTIENKNLLPFNLTNILYINAKDVNMTIVDFILNAGLSTIDWELKAPGFVQKAPKVPFASYIEQNFVIRLHSELENNTVYWKVGVDVFQPGFGRTFTALEKLANGSVSLCLAKGCIQGITAATVVLSVSSDFPSYRFMPFFIAARSINASFTNLLQPKFPDSFIRTAVGDVVQGIHVNRKNVFVYIYFQNLPNDSRSLVNVTIAQYSKMEMMWPLNATYAIYGATVLSFEYYKSSTQAVDVTIASESSNFTDGYLNTKNFTSGDLPHSTQNPAGGDNSSDTSSRTTISKWSSNQTTGLTSNHSTNSGTTGTTSSNSELPTLRTSLLSSLFSTEGLSGVNSSTISSIENTASNTTTGNMTTGITSKALLVSSALSTSSHSSVDTSDSNITTHTPTTTHTNFPITTRETNSTKNGTTIPGANLATNATTYDPDPLFIAEVPVITRVFNAGTVSPISTNTLFVSVTIPVFFSAILLTVLCSILLHIDCFDKKAEDMKKDSINP